jgi:hypothetical protein
MGNAARNHDKGCNDCHHDHDCDGHKKDNVLSREDIHDRHHGDCVRVCGDYDASEHDEVILVFGNGNNVDSAGNQLPSTVELPCPDHLDECDVMTVVSVDAPTIVKGLRNEEVIGANGLPGTGSVRLEVGQQGTFRAIQPRDKCDCPFFLACVC